MNKFRTFRLNFSRDKCLKCIILVTIWTSAGGSPFPTPLNLRFWWPEVAWFCHFVFFKLIMTKSKLKKSDMTSFQWRHRYYVTQKCHLTKVRRFLILGPSQLKFLATPATCTRSEYFLFQPNNLLFLKRLQTKKVTTNFEDYSAFTRNWRSAFASKKNADFADCTRE